MEKEQENVKRVQLASSYLHDRNTYTNPWSVDDFDKLDSYDIKEYKQIVSDCRFFYKHDPLASTTIDKLLDIGVTEIKIDQGTLSDNEYRIFKGILGRIQDFVDKCALEYLTTGLVVPEIKSRAYTKKELERLNIKRRKGLLLPDTLWLRDPGTIKIKGGFLSAKPSYFVEIPDEYIFFIKTDGQWPDGTEDKEAYRQLNREYPELVRAVKAGKHEFKLDNNNVIQGRTLSNSDYPVPFLYPALEPLKHKRNIRRMDYSVASRAIAAIQHVKLGSDEYPVIEEEGVDVFQNIRDQMRQRGTAGTDIERIFQLFTNHTVEIEWVFPNLEALLDSGKYEEINQDIIFALGFPRILMTGEAKRTGTSEAKYAMMSPKKTMERLQRLLLPLVEKIVYDVVEENQLGGEPSDIRFTPINLYDFQIFAEAIKGLYESGNLSRESWAKELGFNIVEELNQRAEENKLLEKLDLEEHGPVPYSETPNKVNKEEIEEDND